MIFALVAERDGAITKWPRHDGRHDPKKRRRGLFGHDLGINIEQHCTHGSTRRTPRRLRLGILFGPRTDLRSQGSEMDSTARTRKDTCSLIAGILALVALFLFWAESFRSGWAACPVNRFMKGEHSRFIFHSPPAFCSAVGLS